MAKEKPKEKREEREEKLETLLDIRAQEMESILPNHFTMFKGHIVRSQILKEAQDV